MAEQNELRKVLFRERKKRYRSRHKSVTLSFSLEVAKALHEEAIRNGKTLPDFIKCLVAASLQGTGYIVPSDSNLQTLLIAMRRIGNNINQLTRHINTEGTITHNDIAYMQKHLLELEQEIKAALVQPQSVSSLLAEYFGKNPEKVQPLINWLHDYQSNSGQK